MINIFCYLVNLVSSALICIFCLKRAAHLFVNPNNSANIYYFVLFMYY